MSGESLAQVAQEIAPELPTRMRDAQQPFGGAQSGAALAAEAELAADHRRSQRLLSPVVSGLM
jgi:hypothetical protein